MSVQTAAPFTATVAPPGQATAPPASVRVGRSRAPQTITLAGLGLASGVLLVWQLG